MIAALEFTMPDTSTLVGRTSRGFGTTVGAWTTQPALLARLDGFISRWVTAVEAACSRFDAASDISRANTAAGSPVRVSPVLVQAVEAALRMAAATDGLCDPTVGLSVIAAGYDRSFEVIEAEGPGQALPHRRGGAWRLVKTDRDSSTVTVPAGYALDLGGSAKGWAVDRAIEVVSGSLLPSFPGAGVCISAGGDLAVGGRPPVGGWPVTIRERLDVSDGVPEREIQLQRGAMATSGATQRQWQRDGHAGHHIIDPATGAPGVSSWALVTTFSDSCLVADTMATAAWLLGEAAPATLEWWGVGARLLDHAGHEVLAGDLSRWVGQK